MARSKLQTNPFKLEVYWMHPYIGKEFGSKVPVCFPQKKPDHCSYESWVTWNQKMTEIKGSNGESSAWPSDCKRS